MKITTSLCNMLPPPACDKFTSYKRRLLFKLLLVLISVMLVFKVISMGQIRDIDIPIPFESTCSHDEPLSFDGFCQRILRSDSVYANVEPVRNRHTYGSKEVLIQRAIDKYISIIQNLPHSPKTTIRIVDLGGYRGELANEIASVCKRLPEAYKCSIISIDSWSALVDTAFDASSQSLDAFKSSVVFNNNSRLITPYKANVLDAGRVLNDCTVNVDMVHIDLSSVYWLTNEVIRLFYPLMGTSPGIFFGSTYCGTGVDRAVRDFIEERGDACEYVEVNDAKDCSFLFVKKV